MYNAVPAAAQAWRELFARVFADAGVAIEVIEHKHPDPIATLWTRPDLACAFMCGWPFTQAQPAMQAIAAPVPSPARYEGQPRYCSEFLVRADSGWTRLEDTFGHRFGWMSRDSQSGFNAPRAHLSRHPGRRDSGNGPGPNSLFSESRGPLGSPMAALEALVTSQVDVIALDSYFLDLVRFHEPARLAQVRCVATTAWTPIPLLAAAPEIDAEVVSRLQAVLLALHERAAYLDLLEPVQLKRFALPNLSAYAVLQASADGARAAGYEEIR
jgi:ABC-type phosphate/phosphonate transport system substrate-binding protein